jgi:hypothetical protein
MAQPAIEIIRHDRAWSMAAKTQNARRCGRATNSHKSETRISAIADFAGKGKRKKKALPLFPRHPPLLRTTFAQARFGFPHHRDVSAQSWGAAGRPRMEPGRHSISLHDAQREAGSRLQEALMPLIYVPLIMYASWMEFLAQPFKAAEPNREMLVAAAKIRRTARQK